ncbi:peptidoglycan binding domain-containing protein, partial [bacterium]|nr:peptidoglycan binding domain-containing protein [bacterium]
MPKNNHSSILTTAALVLACLGTIGGTLLISRFYCQHFLPGVSIKNHDLSHMSLAEALQFTANIDSEVKRPLTLTYQDNLLSTSSAALDFSYNLSETLTTQLSAQANLPLVNLFHQILFPSAKELPLILQYNNDKLNNFIAQFALQINHPGTTASATLARGQIQVFPGRDQVALQATATSQLILAAFPTESSFSAVVDRQVFTLNDTQVDSLRQQAQKLIGKSIVFHTDQLSDFSYTVDD